jgi:hypothetical protein
MVTQALQIFKPKIDLVFQQFGGLDFIKYFLEEEQILDIANFNGPTFTVTPFEFKPQDSDTQLPYYLFDLSTIGYRKNTTYNVLNSRWELLFTGVCPETEVRGERGFYWGTAPAERALIRASSHASQYYLNFRTPDGPVLAQFLVANTLGLEYTERFLSNLESEVAVEQASNYNEVFIYFPKDLPPTGGVRIYSLSSPYESVRSYTDLINNPLTIQTDHPAGAKSVFIKPKAHTWLCIQALDPANPNPIPLKIDEITGLDSWRHKIIESQNNSVLFINAGPAASSAPISRISGALGTPIRTNFLRNDRLRINCFTAYPSG